MSTNRIEYWSRNYAPQLWTLVLINALLGIQLLLAVLYGAAFGTDLLSFHVFLISFIWTTVSVVTVWYTDSVSRGWKPTALAGAVALGYLDTARESHPSREEREFRRSVGTRTEQGGSESRKLW